MAFQRSSWQTIDPTFWLMLNIQRMLRPVQNVQDMPSLKFRQFKSATQRKLNSSTKVWFIKKSRCEYSAGFLFKAFCNYCFFHFEPSKTEDLSGQSSETTVSVNSSSFISNLYFDSVSEHSL
jgi:hypothetical protein